MHHTSDVPAHVYALLPGVDCSTKDVFVAATIRPNSVINTVASRYSPHALLLTTGDDATVNAPEVIRSRYIERFKLCSTTFVITYCD